MTEKKEPYFCKLGVKNDFVATRAHYYKTYDSKSLRDFGMALANSKFKIQNSQVSLLRNLRRTIFLWKTFLVGQ
jgi:hypothetical protein